MSAFNSDLQTGKMIIGKEVTIVPESCLPAWITALVLTVVTIASILAALKLLHLIGSRHNSEAPLELVVTLNRDSSIEGSESGKPR